MTLSKLNSAIQYFWMLLRREDADLLKNTAGSLIPLTDIHFVLFCNYWHTGLSYERLHRIVSRSILFSLSLFMKHERGAGQKTHCEARF